MASRETIRAAYEDACRQEVEALKPGNVHLFADGHRMTVQEFLTSAKVSAAPLTDPSLPLGRRILEAVRATRAAVDTNTNLGIILLCGPLAAAAAMDGANLCENLNRVLQKIDLDDTAAVFEAIVRASPGGLGSASEHDVREAPTVGLLEAMGEAADRDRIARQYVTGFADIFDLGLPALEAAIERGETGMWPAVHAYLEFLTAFPDSHVQRKFDLEEAEQVRDEARSVRAEFALAQNDEQRVVVLMDFDARLKAQGINPGTSADLTVACLLVHNLGVRLARALG
ncbi:triphosphoribosyl-dephospho-CoA synthase [Pseudaminobacter soli (ex Li et al. 2025)]|uniref:Triphosphoribosyl-dephospho-CoA synthase n=1 Tax=Pseudaminobacter soli (ex Li et al. 2025) TaxID=1295366 RepID=A0A2P7S6Y0_9HYPH|nr:triphosphoribosyl-dephospho-CoA synthase [Mesorhizobium soli]PSJ58207.1 triphosphoribosyl-dephospho-CoA synthase [Mesorhizobium soli]